MAPEPVLPTSNNTSSTASVSSARQEAPARTPLLARLREDISLQYADIPVCLCSLVSGLSDSVAFNASSVFVSMQTGNTVFLALGTAGLPANVPMLWLKALCSIVAFMLGVYCFGQSRHFRPMAKGTLAGSFLVQSVAIFAAAALAQGGVVPAFGWLSVAEELAEERDADLKALGPIILLAFQFGGQICTSRILGFNEVPTNVLTSVYCDLFNDPKLFAPWSENPKRNRRASAVVLMLVGAVAGGWLAKSNAGMSTALWIAGAIKFGIAVAWVLWKPKEIGAVEKK
ncbi:hypothetical protein JX265_008392 [Neoarthrinium moseri]|uniref:DUF1275 domain protein n=1 Tax=Neoarthrinium moseri TaxID=1658444 RepID=A0A9P9WHW5_9PEZI|nr:uncharacterized protein JN550_001395 [Neoarthrinium moseri]KAI1845024.1 hypothetical protein JX266_008817 [Neoarthrinium moseri]KAI1864668.1 hypothetical protein JX265_008392 [Neoarthrinium moseri]KAI1875899.1 hypothetical protein JN550_001395 [Neoarthrinium moseri]